jgi:hypothetical protein
VLDISMHETFSLVVFKKYTPSKEVE